MLKAGAGLAMMVGAVHLYELCSFFFLGGGRHVCLYPRTRQDTGRACSSVMATAGSKPNCGPRRANQQTTIYSSILLLVRLQAPTFRCATGRTTHDDGQAPKGNDQKPNLALEKARQLHFFFFHFSSSIFIVSPSNMRCSCVL